MTVVSPCGCFLGLYFLSHDCCIADLLQGKYDDLPEMAFYMVGDITEVQQKADQMAKDIAARKVRSTQPAQGC